MFKLTQEDLRIAKPLANIFIASFIAVGVAFGTQNLELLGLLQGCLLYTSPSPRDLGKSRMPSSA